MPFWLDAALARRSRIAPPAGAALLPDPLYERAGAAPVDRLRPDRPGCFAPAGLLPRTRPGRTRAGSFAPPGLAPAWTRMQQLLLPVLGM